MKHVGKRTDPKDIVSQDQLNSAGNIIINGNFAINQRNASGTVVLAAGQYGHDRWKAGASGCTYTFSSAGGVVTLNITAGSLVQVIGTGFQRAGTYVLSWSGTAQGRIGGGGYSASGVTASVTATGNLDIEFNTGTLSLVQFEAGTSPTPFKQKLISEELLNCQRFYQVGTIEFCGYVVAGTTYYVRVPLKVTMRAAPTVSLISIYGNSFPNSPGTVQAGDESLFESRVCSATSNSGGFASLYTASAEL